MSGPALERALLPTAQVSAPQCILKIRLLCFWLPVDFHGALLACKLSGLSAQGRRK